MREFHGRVVVPGECSGKALVTRTGFNILASYNKSLAVADGACICSDYNNKELYGKSIKGEILCIPQAVGSTGAGFSLQSAAASGLHPKAFLFARRADPLALAGIIIADVWEDTRIITIDELGDEFLASVESGDEISIAADGKVTVM